MDTVSLRVHNMLKKVCCTHKEHKTSIKAWSKTKKSP